MRFSAVVLVLSAFLSVHASKRCVSPSSSTSNNITGAATSNSTSSAAGSHKGHHSSNATYTATATAYNSTATDSSSGNNSSSGGGGSDSNTTGSSGKVYSVQKQLQGSNFFDGFTFYTDSDPTHGLVNYLSQDAATAAGLAYVDSDGSVVLKVDNTNTVSAGGNRNSVRITSIDSYTSGLIVLDVDAMPYGCGVWPAFWTVGADWPSGGEIDIVEGVNNNVNNQYTLHTSSGCTLDTSFEKIATKKRSNKFGARGHKNAANRHRHIQSRQSPASTGLEFTGTVLKTDCDASADGNAGCGIQDPSTSSYGSGLNAAGGGVFATMLDSTGVTIWFFERDSIPADLTSGSPQPSSWGSPKAFWSSSSCPTSQFFGAQSIVINTTLCGDWAGAVYSSDGCPGTCAERVQDPSNFDTAQWKIKSVTVYQ